MKNYLSGILTAGVLGIVFVLMSSKTEAPSTAHAAKIEVDTSMINLKILTPPLPTHLAFAGETVPLHDFDVSERLDRELMVNTYWHSSTLQLLKLSHRYFPIIEPILKEEGVPDDFKYLAVTESGLRPVTSPSHAEGIWQIMKGTGRELGLEISYEVDERYHIEKATRAACQYLKKAKAKFGSWTLAAAAYNCGMPALGKVIESQKADSYYNLYLNTETARYVFRILAIKEIFTNRAKYGFHLQDHSMYPPLQYKMIEVSTAIPSIAEFAEEHGTNYKMLKIYNPWLQRPHLSNKAGKTYAIKVPL